MIFRISVRAGSRSWLGHGLVIVACRLPNWRDADAVSGKDYVCGRSLFSLALAWRCDAGSATGPDDAARPARPLWCCCRRCPTRPVHWLHCVETAQEFADCPRRCDYPMAIQSWILYASRYTRCPHQGACRSGARAGWIRGHGKATMSQGLRQLLQTDRRYADAESPASAGLAIAGLWEASTGTGIRAALRGAARWGWMTVCLMAPPPARCCSPKSPLSIRWNAHMLTPLSDSRPFTVCAAKGAPISSARRAPASDPPSGPRRASARDRRYR